MLAAQVRSDLDETLHDGAIAVVDGSGTLLARHGDIDRPFFIRSSAKPFQAFISQAAGAELNPLELALACASHRGFPVHVALVESMLAHVDLDETSLGCPHAWPLAPAAAHLVRRAGQTEERRIWHNCSGKHAGFFRACVANDWPLDGYLEPSHELQKRVIAFLSEVGDHPVEPVGVDGCGAPVARATARSVATMYARLACDRDFDEVRTNMHRYPALIAANGEGDTELAIATNSVAKGGAAGCLGVGVDGRFGMGVKSWDGQGVIASLAAAAALDQLGVSNAVARRALEPVLHPAVLGGGRRVGRYEPRFRLEQA